MTVGEAGIDWKTLARATELSRPVYVAGYHGEPGRAQDVATALRAFGYRVVSRWHDKLVRHPVGDRRLPLAEAEEVGREDMADLSRAGAILVLWDERCSGAVWELASAWTRGHECVVVLAPGQHITPMARQRDVRFVETLHAAVEFLSGVRGRRA